MNRIKTLCASFVLSCIMGVSVFAQGGYEVKGVVVDAIGPIIGATVIEQGTTNGASTGLDGDYVLTVSSADAVIEISCIGYASQQFVASQVPATVTLSEDTQFLDEVVVIGYGTVKKEDMTGSITAIKSEELNRGAMVNTQDMLKGKVPGLHVIPGDGGPGAGSTIRIRGAASLEASNAPLIIIDGVPVAYGAGAGMSNPLDMINPNDIESFTVLKDASSAAIYGSRASNGVIMITTKKAKHGDAVVNVDAKFGLNTKALKNYDYITDPGQYYEVYYAGLKNFYMNKQGMSEYAAHIQANQIIGGDPAEGGLGYMVYTIPEGQAFIGANGKLNPYATLGRVVDYNGESYYLTPDNWLDETYRQSLRQEYNVSVSGTSGNASVLQEV